MSRGWHQLNIAVIGGGIGGFAAATALRRAGHKVTIYERAHYAGEIGASLSCAANGMKWLQEWNVDISLGKPVTLEKLIIHDWNTGQVKSVYDLSNYKERWLYDYNNFHRVDMQQMLMDSSLGSGDGEPANLKLDHKCIAIDHHAGLVTFENGTVATHDLIVGADGVGSIVRKSLGVIPEKIPCRSFCCHCILPTAEVHRHGLNDISVNNAIEFWGGVGAYKVIYAPCRSGEMYSFYCFFPKSLCADQSEGWEDRASKEQVLSAFSELDPELRALLNLSTDFQPSKLFVTQTYAHWQVGRSCLLGDAAHPMIPDQSQGACQALEDSAALGIIFSDRYSFTECVGEGLKLYEQVRKPRASRVQAASARARENIWERIGFSSDTKHADYHVASEEDKLTIDEVNAYDMHGHIADTVASMQPEDG